MNTPATHHTHHTHTPHTQIAECEEELERLLVMQGEREQMDPEEYSLYLEQAGFPSHEVCVLLLSPTAIVCSCVCVCRHYCQLHRLFSRVWRQSSRDWPLYCRN